MSVCVIHPRASKKSASKLALALKADCVNPYHSKVRDFRKYDVVFNYGCSLPVKANSIINKPWAVEQCVSKTQAYDLLHAAGVPTVKYTRHKDKVPKDWKVVVCRKEEFGHSNDGLVMIHQGDKLPEAAYYSEYYKHKFEFRIVVYKNKVLARYIKKENDDGEWEFIHLEPAGFEAIDAATIKAAKALGIDYAGLDIIAKNQEDFRVLEANSGPIITDDVLTILKKEFANV